MNAKEKLMKTLVHVVAFVLAAALGYWGMQGMLKKRKGAEPVFIDGQTMGTTYRVVLPPHAANLREALVRDIAALFLRLNACMTLYDPSSELSRINADPSATHRLNPDLAEVIRLSILFSRQTHGCFDVTVSPLVELWGFGGKRLPKTRPTDAAIAEALARVGSSGMAVDDLNRLSRSRPGLAIDLGAVAQGYAADRAARFIEERGVMDYLVDVGGEIFCRGKNAQRRLWRIGIEKPSFGRSKVREVNAVMELSGCAVATSGSYRNCYVEDGERYTHVIDPRTGRPVSHVMHSVTVLAPSAAAADAYATALMVMGPNEGYDWVCGMDAVEAFFIFADKDGKTAEKASPGFPLITKRPDA